MTIKPTLKLVSLFAVVGLLAACNQDLDSDSDADTQKDTAALGTLIELEGEDNFRDMGGFIGVDGRHVVSGKLYRSGELSHLTDSDQQVLTDLSIEHLIDLRSASEIADDPDQIPNQITVHHIPLIEEDDSEESGAVQVNMLEQYVQMLIAADYDASSIMLPAYTDIDDYRIAQWTQVFDVLEQGEATVWHCTAGQDRAGMTAALVLASLGVAREDIFTDYLASNTYTYADKAQTAAYMAMQVEGADEQKLLEAMLIKREYLQAFFDTIETQYGDVDTFLQVLGVDIEQMQANYLSAQ